MRFDQKYAVALDYDPVAKNFLAQTGSSTAVGDTPIAALINLGRQLAPPAPQPQAAAAVVPAPKTNPGSHIGQVHYTPWTGFRLSDQFLDLIAQSADLVSRFCQPRHMTVVADGYSDGVTRVTVYYRYPFGATAHNPNPSPNRLLRADVVVEDGINPVAFATRLYQALAAAGAPKEI